mmetsp:Transcript_24447/g.71978  ORF Transcript_24447/g.71978 Transcript_24447/m.71978 type:complete len:297 (+) Transcript_24447:878-1768(+)
MLEGVGPRDGAAGFGRTDDGHASVCQAGRDSRVQPVVGNDDHSVDFEGLRNIQEGIVALAIEPATGIHYESSHARTNILFSELPKDSGHALHRVPKDGSVVAGVHSADPVRKRRRVLHPVSEVKGRVPRCRSDGTRNPYNLLVHVKVDKYGTVAPACCIVCKDTAHGSLASVLRAHNHDARSVRQSCKGCIPTLLKLVVELKHAEHRSLLGGILVCECAFDLQDTPVPREDGELYTAEGVAPFRNDLCPEYFSQPLLEGHAHLRAVIHLEAPFLVRSEDDARVAQEARGGHERTRC